MIEVGRPYSRLLSRLDSITTVSADDRRRIAELPLTVRNFAPNHDIVRQGDSPAQCVLLLDGYLLRHKLANGASRQIVSFHVPGDIPDLHTLNLPRMDHNLSTLGPAVVAFVPHGALRKMLEASPALTGALWRMTLIDGSIFREWVVNLGRREAIARVAHLLCEMLLRLRAVGLARGDTVLISWTQADVADACGISTVHANRVVQELRRLRLVEWDSRRVRVLDLPGLMDIGDFSPDYLHLISPGWRDEALDA